MIHNKYGNFQLIKKMIKYRLNIRLGSHSSSQTKTREKIIKGDKFNQQKDIDQGRCRFSSNSDESSRPYLSH